MKKIINTFVIFSFIFVFITFGISKTFAASYDQGCTFSPSSWRSASGYLVQTFKPSMDWITQIDLEIWGGGIVTIRLTDSPSGILLEKTVTLNPPPSHKIYSITFDSIPVTPNDIHYIYLMDATSDGSWAYTGNASCYPNGEALDGGAHVPGIEDFYFKTYGYNDAESSPAPSQDNQSSPSQTSATIEAPTDLKAEFEPDEEAVILTWDTSSTQDLDTYRVFRSEQKDNTEDFKEIGGVLASKNEFKDQNIESKKTYYYYIRAHKDGEDSENSEIVSIKLPQIEGEGKAAKKKSENESDGINWVFWGLITILILTTGGIGLYWYIKKRKKKSLGKSHALPNNKDKKAQTTKIPEKISDKK